MVRQDAIQSIVSAAALSAKTDPPTANLALRLLNDLSRFDGATEKLEAAGGLAAAREACEAMPPASVEEAERCRELAAELGRAIGA